MFKILIGVVIAAFVVIIGFLIIDPDLNQSATTPITEVSDTTSGSKYTIEGEVNKAGTYVLSDAVTMADLIEAAGGTNNNADDLCYFESAPLKSGSTYYIAGKYDATDICSKDEITKVNINEDDASTLMSVNGITTSIASSIVSYRTENGIFDTLEELMEVYGIGNATYHKIRNYVILHSWSFYSSSFRFGLV